MDRAGRWRTLLRRLTPLLLLGFASASAEDAAVVTLVDTDFAASDLACPANGQAVYCLDQRTGTVVAVDPRTAAKRRTAVAAAPADGPRPLAIACIDTNTLAALCRDGDAWSIRTWRLQPDAPADFSAPLQDATVGTAGGSALPPHLLVGPAREWLVVTGLPDPLPPFVRAAIAGTRVGKPMDRSCPPRAEAAIVAVAANSLDETMLFTAGRDRAVRLTFHDRSGRPLLDLACDLPAVRDAACCVADGTLWAVGGDGSAARPEGLWRLDAAMDGGRQVVRPVCVARLAAPQAVACVAHTAVVVAHGAGGRTLVRFDLFPRNKAATAAAPGATP